MTELIERKLVGLDYLRAGCELLGRIRNAHPTKGQFEAAELNWWWAHHRSTHDVEQLFWFDGAGNAEAAAIATDWGGLIGLDVAVMPDAPTDHIAHVLDRGLAHTAELGYAAVDVLVDRADDTMRSLLANRGFNPPEGEAAMQPDVEAWIAADAVPPVSALADGYVLRSRPETMSSPHHMADERRPDVEERLLQGPMYRPDLDLVLLDDDGAVGGYGLFWFDPATAIGVVEPMHTNEGHRQRGIARHILTEGLQRLVAIGAERIKIVFFPDNTAAANLYTDVGFEPAKYTEMMSLRR